jgi:hypothetical protein
MSIIRSSRVLYRWLLAVVFGALVFNLSVCYRDEGYVSGLKTKAPNTTGGSHLYNTLEILVMGIVVPETCSANNKICNKKISLAFYFRILTTMHGQNHIKMTSIQGVLISP